MYLIKKSYVYEHQSDNYNCCKFLFKFVILYH